MEMTVMILLILLFIPIVYSAVSKQDGVDDVGGNGENTECNNGVITEPIAAKVVARYSVSDPRNPEDLKNVVLFEFESGNRDKLEVKDQTIFYTMLEGEIGRIE